MRFDLQPVRDRRCLTACTDNGKTIYFNCDFYLGLSQQERVFVMAHEIWHSLNLTFARRQTRDPELWNIASDMEINNILSDSNQRGAYAPPKNLMFPPAKLKGKSAETIYDWLLKQQEKNNLNNALSKMAQPDSVDSDDDSRRYDNRRFDSRNQGGSVSQPAPRSRTTSAPKPRPSGRR